MAADWTKAWSGRGAQRSANGREYTEAYHVNNADTAASVYTATHSDGTPFPRIGDPHPDDPLAVVNRISAPSWLGPQFAEVNVIYRTSGSRGGGASPEDPLDNETIYRPRFAVRAESTDVDVHGNPILNSAGDVFGSKPQGTYTLVGLDIIRNEPGFSIPFALGFVDKVNSDEFKIANYIIKPGQAYCANIAPERGYKLSERFVPILYSFDFHELFPGDGDPVKRSFFHHRIIDQGKRAWGYPGTRDSNPADAGVFEILDGEGKPVTTDVLLDGKGAPLKPDNYRFGGLEFDDNAGWQENPDAPPPGATIINTAVGAKALLYDRHLATPMAPLNL